VVNVCLSASEGHSMHEMQLLSASAGSGSSLSPRVKVISAASSALDVKRRLKQRLSTTSWDSDSENDWSDSEQQVNYDDWSLKFDVCDE
jgi:hypothetical protein